MALPWAIERIRSLTDLNTISQEHAELTQEIFDLYILLFEIAEKEIAMFNIDLISEEMTDDQAILKDKINEFINVWK